MKSYDGEKVELIAYCIIVCVTICLYQTESRHAERVIYQFVGDNVGLHRQL